MQCPACGTANNSGRVYCGGCARAVGEVCPVCFFLNEPVDRYCGGCARDLLVAPIEPAPAGQAAPAVKAAAAPVAGRDQGGFAGDMEDLSDLTGGIAPVVSAAEPVAGAADATQGDVDGFFQRLAREGGGTIDPPSASGEPPGPVRRTPS